MARAERNDFVDILRNPETSRYGEPLLSKLQEWFTWMHGAKTKAKHRTEFFPVFFACSNRLCGTDGHWSPYIRREPSIFISTLVMVALECVVNQRIGNRSIGVICYLTAVVEDLKAFFEKYLETVCKEWHEMLFPDEKMGSYNIERLRKTVSLAIRGPFEVKGKNSDIVFLLSMKRQTGDSRYQGLMTEPQLAGMHYTRVRHRMYNFIHDLLPPVSANREMKKDNKQDRTLTFFGGLRNTTIETWHYFSADKYSIGNEWQTNWQMITSLKEDFPFLYQNSFRDSIVRDLKDTDVKIGRDFWNIGYWKGILHKGFDFWSEMTARYEWPVPDTDSSSNVGQNTINDISWWKKTLGSNPQCRPRMMKDKRRKDDLSSMRTEKQLAEDGDVDKGVQPTRAQVFETWKSSMLNCSTVTLTSSGGMITICLPFSRLHKEHVFDTMSTIGDDVIYKDSAGWLARALAEATETAIENSGKLLFSSFA